jgi:glycosyltransferase involved in cell wall biosynthesis
VRSGRPRVLHVINSLALAGAESLVTDMAPRLRDLGFDVEVAVLSKGETHLQTTLGASGVPVTCARATHRYSPVHVHSIHRLMREADLVHVHLFPSQLWAAAARCLFRGNVPMVTSEHGSSNNRRGMPLVRVLDRLMYAAYDAVICNSRATATALCKWAPTVQSRIVVIPNGVDLERFRAAPAANRDQIVGGQQGPIAMFVARMDPQKDHATLLRAAAAIENLQLVLVGDGELRPQLQAMAISLGIAHRVHFLGRRHDVPSLLKLADLYVHSTKFEGFGIAALEAMAAGVPVVGSNVAGLAEVVSDAGLLVAPGNASGLAQAMRAVLCNPELHGDLRRRGIARAHLFDISKTVSEHARIYDSLLMVRNAAPAKRTATLSRV